MHNNVIDRIPYTNKKKESRNEQKKNTSRKLSKLQLKYNQINKVNGKLYMIHHIKGAENEGGGGEKDFNKLT